MAILTRFLFRLSDARQLLILMGCVALIPPSAHGGEAFTVAIPGQYLEADRVESGDGWWGLFREGQVLRLTMEPTTVTVRAVHNRFQKPAEEPSDVEVSVPQNNMAPVVIVVIVRGFEHLQAGPLKTTFWNFSWSKFLYPGQSKNITIEGEVRFAVSALGTAEEPTRESDTRFRNYRVVMKRWAGKEIRRQTLLSNSDLGRYSFPQILWAGDLDRDGMPDLIMDQSTREFRIHLVLYLSSKAGEGELVGRVAEWKARTDC